MDSKDGINCDDSKKLGDLVKKERSKNDTIFVTDIIKQNISISDKISQIIALDKFNKEQNIQTKMKSLNDSFIDPHIMSYISKARNDTDKYLTNFERDYSKKYILIIDDLTYITKTVSFFLKKEDFEVYSASTAMEGILLFQRIVPDVIITDIKLPDINGYKLASIFRKIDEEIPIIFITATDVDINSYYSFTGKKAYLQKPIKKDDLIAVIYDLLHPSGERPGEVEELEE